MRNRKQRKVLLYETNKTANFTPCRLVPYDERRRTKQELLARDFYTKATLVTDWWYDAHFEAHLSLRSREH